MSIQMLWFDFPNIILSLYLTLKTGSMACDAENEISSQKANETDSSHAINCSFIHFL